MIFAPFAIGPDYQRANTAPNVVGDFTRNQVHPLEVSDI